jgi:hypothetical protein
MLMYALLLAHSLSNVLDIKKLFDCFVDVSSGRARVAVMLEHPAVQRDAAMKDALWTAVKTASAAAATAKANAAAAAAVGGSTALKPGSSSSTSYSSYAGSYGSGTQLSLKLSELMAAVFTYAKDEELRRMQHAVDIARLLERVRERLRDEACHLEVASSSTDTLHGQLGQSQNQQQQQQQHRVRHPSALSSNSSTRAAGGSSSSARAHKGVTPAAVAAADTSGTAEAAVVSPRAGAAAAWHNGEALLNKKGHAIHLPLSAMQDIAQVCNCRLSICSCDCCTVAVTVSSSCARNHCK